MFSLTVHHLLEKSLPNNIKFCAIETLFESDPDTIFRTKSKLKEK